MNPNHETPAPPANGGKNRLRLFRFTMLTAFLILLITLCVEHLNRSAWHEQPMDTTPLWLLFGNFQGVGLGLLKSMKPEDNND